MKTKILIILGSVLSFLAIPTTVLAQMYEPNNKGLNYTYRGNLDPNAFSGFFAATWIGVFVIICITWAIWLAVAIWIYKDAKKHYVENPALWAFIVFFVGVIGLLIYLLAARKTKSTLDPVKQKEPVGPVNTTA